MAKTREYGPVRSAELPKSIEGGEGQAPPSTAPSPAATTSSASSFLQVGPLLHRGLLRLPRRRRQRIRHSEDALPLDGVNFLDPDQSINHVNAGEKGVLDLPDLVPAHVNFVERNHLVAGDDLDYDGTKLKGDGCQSYVAQYFDLMEPRG